MRGMRLAIALVTVATLVALFVVARPDDDGGAAPGAPPSSTPTRTTPPEVEPLPETTAETTTASPAAVRLDVRVADGRPAGGIVRGEARKGDAVVLVVRSDVADHVHVHGYDLLSDVGPGRPATLRFRASLTGRFEIELEELGRQVAQLTVVP